MENQELDSSKKQLVVSILKELEQIPQGYLKVIFSMIQAFRKNLPIVKNESTIAEENEFDWEELSSEIIDRRKTNNRDFFDRIDEFVKE